MTQAELAGGAIDAPGTSPLKGHLIRDFTLTSSSGQSISLSDYRGRSNLVLIFAGSGADGLHREILAEAAAHYARLQGEQAEVLAILQCGREGAARIGRQASLPFPLLIDEDGRIHCTAAGAVDLCGHPATTIYITDRFGEVFAGYRTAEGKTMPSAQEMLKWLNFINMQCPECGHPEWPA